MINEVQVSNKDGQFREKLSDLFWTGVAPLRRLGLPSMLGRHKEVNVHFGCGKFNDPRFINVDARPWRHVHLMTKSPMLAPLPSASADSFYACHVFEHLGFLVQEDVLRRWKDILKPGGTIRLSVPDFDKLVDRFLASGRDPDSIQEILMGGQDYPGNFHYAIFTDRHLRELLARCGFVDIAAWHPRDLVDWPRDYSWSDDVSLNLAARKPSS